MLESEYQAKSTEIGKKINIMKFDARIDPPKFDSENMNKFPPLILNFLKF